MREVLRLELLLLQVDQKTDTEWVRGKRRAEAGSPAINTGLNSISAHTRASAALALQEETRPDSKSPFQTRSMMQLPNLSAALAIKN